MLNTTPNYDEETDDYEMNDRNYHSHDDDNQNHDDEMLHDVDEQTERKKTVRLAKTDANYVQGAEINAAAEEYSKAWHKWNDSKEKLPRPVMSDKLALMITKIANRTVYNPKFIKFPSIRDEMVSGAIMDCIAYGHNFNVDAVTRSGQINAFSYFSTICMNAYIKRIKTEKRQYLTKVKYVQSVEMSDRIAEIFENCDDDSSDGVVSQIRNYYNATLPEPKRKPQEGDPDYIKPDPVGLEHFLF